MGFVAAEVSNGLGRKRYYLAPGGYKKFLKYDYLDWVQVFLTLMLSKISICLFLLRLSSFRKIRLGLHAMIIFLVTSHVPLTFLIIFQCSPISKYWRNALSGPGYCFTKATVETIIIIQGGELLRICSPHLILQTHTLYVWPCRRCFATIVNFHPLTDCAEHVANPLWAVGTSGAIDVADALTQSSRSYPISYLPHSRLCSFGMSS